MNKKNYILIAIVVIILLLSVVFVFFKKEGKMVDTSDSVVFKSEYTEIPLDNVFVYKTEEEIINIMKSGTGIVYLGFPECKWCQSYVVILNEVAKEVGITKIFYNNILDSRKNNTSEYQQMVKILGDHLQLNDDGDKRIFVPNVSFHVNGEIIGNNYETSLDTLGFDEPSDYWTDERKKSVKETLTKYMKELYLKSNACSSCNE